MTIEIDNLPQFATYCAHENVLDKKRDDEEPSVLQKLACAELWAQWSVNARAQYGGGMEGNISLGLQYAQKPKEAEYPGPIQEGGNPRYSQEVVLGAAEILRRFWKHREAFDKWFTSQALVIPATGNRK